MKVKKRFKVGFNIGNAKYVISFHDGKSKHKDGSDFFGIETFRNQKDFEKGQNDLRKKGYIEESINEKLSVDPRKVYGGTGAKQEMVLTAQKGLQKILDLSKKNPSNVFKVSDDNYTNFGPYYVKNGKIAKYTVANPNYDLQNNKVRSLKVPSDVILKFTINESQPFADFPQFPKLSRDQQESLDELFGFAESYQIFNSFNNNPKKFIQTLDDMAKIRKASNKQPKSVSFNKGKKEFVK